MSITNGEPRATSRTDVDAFLLDIEVQTEVLTIVVVNTADLSRGVFHGEQRNFLSAEVFVIRWKWSATTTTMGTVPTPRTRYTNRFVNPIRNPIEAIRCVLDVIKEVLEVLSRVNVNRNVQMIVNHQLSGL